MERARDLIKDWSCQPFRDKVTEESLADSHATTAAVIAGQLDEGKTDDEVAALLGLTMDEYYDILF